MSRKKPTPSQSLRARPMLMGELIAERRWQGGLSSDESPRLSSRMDAHLRSDVGFLARVLLLLWSRFFNRSLFCGRHLRLLFGQAQNG